MLLPFLPHRKWQGHVLIYASFLQNLLQLVQSMSSSLKVFIRISHIESKKGM